MSSSVHRKLRALGYPALDSLVSDGDALRSLSSRSLRTLVAWLEASKIRLLPVAERAPLQAVTDDQAWPAAFSAYLQALNCTCVPVTGTMSAEEVAVVADWLATQAVAAEYSDHMGEFNSLSKMWFISAGTEAATPGSVAASAAGAKQAAQSAAVLDCTSSDSVRADFESEMRQLAQLFQLPFMADQQAAMLRVVRKRVEECIVAEAAAQQLQTPPPPQPATHAAAASSSSSTAASSKPSSKRIVRQKHTGEPAPIPTSREEVFAALDKLESGFPNTGGQSCAGAGRMNGVRMCTWRVLSAHVDSRLLAVCCPTFRRAGGACRRCSSSAVPARHARLAEFGQRAHGTGAGVHKRSEDGGENNRNHVHVRDRCNDAAATVTATRGRT